MKHAILYRCALWAAAAATLLPAAYAAASHADLRYAPMSTSAPTQGQDRFIISYRDPTVVRRSPAVVQQDVSVALQRAGIDTAGSRQGVSHLRRLAVGAELVRTGRKLGPAEANALMQQLTANPAVLFVQPDTLLQRMDERAMGAVTPNDPQFDYQWHLRAGHGAMEKIGGDALAYANVGGINAPAAWNLSQGEGVVVAVIDTGITQHPDLDLSLADAGYDFISDKALSGRADDSRVPGGWDLGDWTVDEQCGEESRGDRSSWHGTHVAGTVAELTNNGVGMAGVAPKAKVLPVRVLGRCGGYHSDIADGIVWAAGGSVDGVPANRHPAQVINMSLGEQRVCEADSVMAQAIISARAMGSTVVVSAGNSNIDAAGFNPASCPGVLSVAATGMDGKRAYYSNFGQGVTLSAPGGARYVFDALGQYTEADAGGVWSAGNRGVQGPGEPTYTRKPGTSMAAPHVAGVIALVASARKAQGLDALNPDQMSALLQRTARAFPTPPDAPIGPGILDAYAAVLSAGVDVAPDVSLLINGRLHGNLAAPAGQSLLFAISVPAGARNFNLRTMGGTGDVSMFVKRGAVPEADGGNADFRSAKRGNSESAVIAQPAAGVWYVRVLGVQDFAKVSVIGSFKEP